MKPKNEGQEGKSPRLTKLVDDREVQQAPWSRSENATLRRSSYGNTP